MGFEQPTPVVVLDATDVAQRFFHRVADVVEPRKQLLQILMLVQRTSPFPSSAEYPTSPGLSVPLRRLLSGAGGEAGKTATSPPYAVGDMQRSVCELRRTPLLSSQEYPTRPRAGLGRILAVPGASTGLIEEGTYTITVETRAQKGPVRI